MKTRWLIILRKTHNWMTLKGHTGLKKLLALCLTSECLIVKIILLMPSQIDHGAHVSSISEELW